MKQSKRDILEGLLLVSPFLYGLWFPWTAAPAALVLLALAVCMQRRGELRLSLSPMLLAAGSVPLLLLGGAVWGTDRGMALQGTLLFLPLPLFALLLEQREPNQRLRLLKHMPEAASLMVLLSMALLMIPGTRAAVSVNGRLAGCFQYPNTFAMYLLAALTLLLESEDRAKRLRSAETLVLLSGILLSGSRAVYLLTLLTTLALLLLRLSKGCGKDTRCLLCIFGLLLLGGGFSALLAGQARAFSLNASELLGRLLYMQDAVPVILHHPVGLGYLGYSWLQGSFQTGVYSVIHVHNDLLQLLLDAGWIPGLLLLWALFGTARRKSQWSGRLALLPLCLHALCDFDLQFVSMCFLFLTLADTEPRAGSVPIPTEKRTFRRKEKTRQRKRFPHRKNQRPAHAERTIRRGKRARTDLLQTGQDPLHAEMLTSAAALLLGAFCIWQGAVSLLLFAGNPRAALRLSPSCTSAMVQMLEQSENALERGELAERILRLNPSVPAARAARAEAAFAAGDLEEALNQKKAEIRLTKYQLSGYLEYLDLLELAYRRSRSSGDVQSAGEYRRQMLEIPELLEQVKSETSSLGRKIRDLPRLDLPEDAVQRLRLAA